MELLVVLLAIVLLILGLLGSFVPAIPGPPLSYMALLLVSLFTSYTFSQDFLIMWAGIVITVMALDYWLQVYGVKKFGGKKKAINGTLIGLVVGMFAPIPFGFLLGPFAGAFIGAYLEEKEDFLKVLLIAMGALAGFLSGAVLKLAVSAYLGYEFIKVLLNG